MLPGEILRGRRESAGHHVIDGDGTSAPDRVGRDSGEEWKYVPVRRLARSTSRRASIGVGWAVFESNDEPTSPRYVPPSSWSSGSATAEASA